LLGQAWRDFAALPAEDRRRAGIWIRGDAVLPFIGLIDLPLPTKDRFVRALLIGPETWAAQRQLGAVRVERTASRASSLLATAAAGLRSRKTVSATTMRALASAIDLVDEIGDLANAHRVDGFLASFNPFPADRPEWAVLATMERLR